MSNVTWLAETIERGADGEAIVWRDRSYSYAWLSQHADLLAAGLAAEGVNPGDAVAVIGDFSPTACALLLALIGNRNVIVPLTSVSIGEQLEFLDIAGVGHTIRVQENDEPIFEMRDGASTHELYGELHRRDAPGLVLFSSGSTGKTKAALHDLSLLLEKFRVPRPALRTITFLMFDHIGGVNTLFYVLANHGTVVAVEDRRPDVVCAAVARHGVELLPTSPTFLRLLLLSEAHERHDLSSLKVITYGTEPMPESTLARLHSVFPGVRLKQTYGLSELGILRAKSRADGSLWVKVGGEGYETRVVDGLLHIRARSAMLGYLNAPNPFDREGWMNTGDVVEVDGDWLRILGRSSDMINVGGQKVYPAEVEAVLLEMPGVLDATVFGEPNALLGNIVVARLTLDSPEDRRRARGRVRAFCRHRLAPYKIPQRVIVSESADYNYRYKKMRSARRRHQTFNNVRSE